MRRKPFWDEEGRDWPNRAASRFVTAAGISWHVQIMGSGPVILLIHGTGAATHSWRDLAPLLATDFTIVAADLPGHGFTEKFPGRQLSLPQMAEAITTLLAALELAPVAIVGHSAGAAIALRMVLDRKLAPPHAVISLNGALSPFPGLASVLFPALARLMFLNPFAAPILASRAADPMAVARLIKGTGSTLDSRGLEFYRRLLRTERHVEATLGMMANWDLRPLQRDLPGLSVALTLVAADRDRAVPVGVAIDASERVKTARVVRVPNRGHLLHEEEPAMVAGIIRGAIGRAR